MSENLSRQGESLRIVTLDELKAQMRVEDTVEDELVCAYGRAAEGTVLRHTRRSVSELALMNYEEQNGPLPDGAAAPGVEWFPASLKVAILMLAAHLYRNREVAGVGSMTAIPYTMETLVKPWTRLGNDNGE